MKNAHQETYHFLDQNVMEKMSKLVKNLKEEKQEKYQAFQSNFEKTLMKPDINQALTPFSLLEFAGIKARDIIKILYNKDIPLNEYPCRYEELKKITKFLMEEIEKKVTKCFLIEKLSEKKYLNKVGGALINAYINSIKEDRHYDNLIRNLYLDRLPQINISKFTAQEKEKFNKHYFYPSIIRNISHKNRTVGSLRAIKKACKSICQDIKKQFPKDMKLNKVRKIMIKELEDSKLKLKLYGDLVDCELIHLAFFGYHGDPCHCYTADKKETIKRRLDFYCKGVYFIERWFHEYFSKTIPDWEGYCKKHLLPQRPEWKCGKVFVLDRETGEKIEKISVSKIYNEIKTYIDSELHL